MREGQSSQEISLPGALNRLYTELGKSDWRGIMKSAPGAGYGLPARKRAFGLASPGTRREQGDREQIQNLLRKARCELRNALLGADQ